MSNAARELQTTTISPTLSVRNCARTIEFYEAAFSAQVLFREGHEGGGVVADLPVDDARHWLADESPEHFKFSSETFGGGSVRLVLTVEIADLYALFERTVRAGAKQVRPVLDQLYGWRVRRVVDPFVHHRNIGKTLL